MKELSVFAASSHCSFTVQDKTHLPSLSVPHPLTKGGAFSQSDAPSTHCLFTKERPSYTYVLPSSSNCFEELICKNSPGLVFPFTSLLVNSDAIWKAKKKKTPPQTKKELKQGHVCVSTDHS